MALTLAGGVAGNALWDLAKGRVLRWTRRRVEVVELQLPDGTRLFVLKIEEG